MLSFMVLFIKIPVLSKNLTRINDVNSSEHGFENNVILCHGMFHNTCTYICAKYAFPYAPSGLVHPY